MNTNLDPLRAQDAPREGPPIVLSEPRFDLQFQLAQSLTWQRYRDRIHRRFSTGGGTHVHRAITEHSNRLQRLSEGLAAFATTGAQEEVQWFFRPCLEVFASQCILQYGHVQHPERRAMTKDEKAEAYFLHGDFVQLQLLRKHKDWEGSKLTVEAKEAKIQELEVKLSQSPFVFSENKPWHLMDLSSAVAKGLKSRERTLGAFDLMRFGKLFPVMKDFLDLGIHGASFSARFLHRTVSPGSSEILDDRTPKNPNNSMFVALLAHWSLEMLAHEVGESPLIQPMLESAFSDMAEDDRRWIKHFPTASVHLR